MSFSTSLDRWRRGPLAALLGALFVLWHVALLFVGLRFDTSPLQSAWQILDPQWLKADLLRSLLYLHSQPPLFNLLIGLILKAAPGHAPALFQAVFVGIAFVLYVSLFGLMRSLGVGRLLALVVSTAFMVSASVLLYENWLFYTLPVAALVTLSTWLIAESLARPRRLLLFLALCSVAALGMLRSVFHPLHFVIVVAALGWALPAERRRVLACAALPFACVVALAVRNAVLFGSLTSSTWLGMSVARVVTEGLTPSERASLAAHLPLVAIQPFSKVSVYRPYASHDPVADVPALIAARKESGAVNFNNAVYIGVSRRYLRESLKVIRLDPAAALRGVARAWLTYIRPTTEYGPLEPNASRLRRWVTLNEALTLEFPLPSPWFGFTELPLTTALGIPFLLAFGCWLAVKRPPWARLTREQALMLLYICAMAAGFALVVNTFETGENNRFRAEIDPLHAVLLAVALDRILVRRRQKRSQCGSIGFPS